MRKTSEALTPPNPNRDRSWPALLCLLLAVCVVGCSLIPASIGAGFVFAQRQADDSVTVDGALQFRSGVSSGEGLLSNIKRACVQAKWVSKTCPDGRLAGPDKNRSPVENTSDDLYATLEKNDLRSPQVDPRMQRWNGETLVREFFCDGQPLEPIAVSEEFCFDGPFDDRELKLFRVKSIGAVPRVKLFLKVLVRAELKEALTVGSRDQLPMLRSP